MKHPIYAILLAAIISFTFWSEIPVNNNKRLEETKTTDLIEKQENVSADDSLSSKTEESKKNKVEIIDKNVPSLERTVILKENKVNPDSAIANISLPSDKQ